MIEPRIETTYWKPGDEVNEDGDATLVPCDKADATQTMFCLSSVHPVDHHEFGLSLIVTDVADEIGEHYMFVALQAMDKYLAEHPDGETVDV